MMRPDDVLLFVRKRPFVPFRITLTDGTTYDVVHPEFAMVARTRVVVGIPRTRDVDRGRWVPDRLVHLDLLHIMQIEPLEAEAA